MQKSNSFKGVRVYRVLSNGGLVASTVEPIGQDSLSLCERIVEAVEARAELKAWLSGEGRAARLCSLLAD